MPLLPALSVVLLGKGPRTTKSENVPVCGPTRAAADIPCGLVVVDDKPKEVMLPATGQFAMYVDHKQ